ncbi:MAG TPA: aromatic hydrocarbon degradation protein [Campylobacterales bacterium]|nr:aromatic hydrocarbon degradation protein [Campylobacterales bacterium]
MRKTILLSIVTTSVVFATNGDNLIGVGTKSRGMGGAGIGISHCAESTLQNPALISCTKGTSISFGGTIFMPKIKEKMGGASEHESDADMNIIPSVSISQKLNENWFLGIGMWGTAGMGVDYRDAQQSPTDSGNMHMVTNLQLMQFGTSLAYRTGNMGLAVTPVLQYGSLDINYQGFDGSNIGDGIAQDLGYGVNLGAYYDVANGVTLGAVYKSEIDMEYKNQLSTATKPFVDFGIFPQAMSDHLEQPAEIGMGIGYEFGQHNLAFDAKQIKWSDAKGYKDFGWEDQNVYALGYQFKGEQWRFRAGYNHASHPISEKQSGPAVIKAGSYAQAGGNAMNLFNVSGFPATAENHYTLGLGYEFTKNFYVDTAFVYAPETTTTMKTIVGMNPQNGDLYTGDTSVKHAESSLSLQLSYRFF